jgi:Uma2 family endonuclease
MSVMAGGRSGLKLTYDDFVRFPEDGQRHELIDGEHYVTPTPIRRHQKIAMKIGVLIQWYLEQHPTGEMFSVAMDVILSNVDVVEPDILYVSHERLAQFEPSDWVNGPPNLVAEIASPSTRKRDATIKRNVYERFGVDEYWIVEPADDTIQVYRLVHGRYGLAAVLARERGDALTTPLFPGLTLPLAKIFEG